MDKLVPLGDGLGGDGVTIEVYGTDKRSQKTNLKKQASIFSVGVADT